MVDRVKQLHDLVVEGTRELYELWDEIGLDSTICEERQSTVEEHFRGLLRKMIEEEKKLKRKLVDSLEVNIKLCCKLSKELGTTYSQPDSDMALLKLEYNVRNEAARLQELKEEKLVEVKRARKMDEEVCSRLGRDPYYISTTCVPSPQQMEGLLEHIKELEEEKFVLEEKYVRMKEDIINLYEELECEPVTDLEREIACEDTERFVLSGSNMSSVGSVLHRLEEVKVVNQKEVMMLEEKMDSLYARLQLRMDVKHEFLASCQGHSQSTITRLRDEVERLEEIKKANIEKFVNTLRNELHKLWDLCFYSPAQRNAFQPLHSIDFTENLLEMHELEVESVKNHLEIHRDLYEKVRQWQDVWCRAMDLERKAKDPSRLMNARGNSLLMEEKERNKVNKQLPRVEAELGRLIEEWENSKGSKFLVGGCDFKEYVEGQKREHVEQLEAEKSAREKAKKETLLQETRFGAKPVTPAKLRAHTSSAALKTPLRTPNRNPQFPTPSSTKIVSRVAKNSVAASMRSPRGGRVGKGISPRIGGKKEEKNKIIVKKEQSKMKKGVLTDVSTNASRIVAGTKRVASYVPDYQGFKRGNIMNSTEAEGHHQ